MPTRKSNVKPEDVPAVEMTEEEATKIQEEEINGAAEVAKLETPNAVECKFAKDPDDLICKDCEGDPYDTVCEIDEDTNMCAAYEEGPSQYRNADQTELEPVTSSETKINPPSLHSNNEEVSEQVKGETATIQAEISVTKQLTDSSGEKVWVKASFSELRKLPKNCNLEDERIHLWDDVEQEVDAQIDRLCSLY